VALLGYFAGASYQNVESALGRGSAVLLVVLALVALVVWHRSRRGHTPS
jgi:membrane protein DedA with SNARE-associated domain